MGFGWVNSWGNDNAHTHDLTTPRFNDFVYYLRLKQSMLPIRMRKSNWLRSCATLSACVYVRLTAIVWLHEIFTRNSKPSGDGRVSMCVQPRISAESINCFHKKSNLISADILRIRPSSMQKLCIAFVSISAKSETSTQQYLVWVCERVLSRSLSEDEEYIVSIVSMASSSRHLSSNWWPSFKCQMWRKVCNGTHSRWARYLFCLSFDVAARRFSSVVPRNRRFAGTTERIKLRSSQT